MTKPVVLRALADADIDAAVDHYLAEAPRVAGKLLTAVRRTIAAIGRSPGVGSLRYAHELDIPGLRHRRIPRFPYLVFYLEGALEVSVLRVLHQGRDIPSELDPE